MSSCTWWHQSDRFVGLGLGPKNADQWSLLSVDFQVTHYPRTDIVNYTSGQTFTDRIPFFDPTQLPLDSSLIAWLW